jgi:hypothetical protein
MTMTELKHRLDKYQEPKAETTILGELSYRPNIPAVPNLYVRSIPSDQ